MPKKVAVQKGLENLKEELSKSGYQVFDIGEGEAVEAIIYMADGHHIPDYNQFTSMTAGTDMDSDKGVVLINATGKTTADIEYAINHRVYSRLL